MTRSSVVRARGMTTSTTPIPGWTISGVFWFGRTTNSRCVSERYRGPRRIRCEPRLHVALVHSASRL